MFSRPKKHLRKKDEHRRDVRAHHLSTIVCKPPCTVICYNLICMKYLPIQCLFSIKTLKKTMLNYFKYIHLTSFYRAILNVLELAFRVKPQKYALFVKKKKNADVFLSFSLLRYYVLMKNLKSLFIVYYRYYKQNESYNFLYGQINGWYQAFKTHYLVGEKHIAEKSLNPLLKLLNSKQKQRPTHYKNVVGLKLRDLMN
ncbi:hypothetical protein AGLY_013635 [Aphis glycines]|uniref:Uncharacterized protein n=1 Tax=Aphis glycines TaxID=307491 RepID=A0A6G0T718_APHGL|nr:hypothetical protein AGLY_013635 [Aphis glycines]